MSDGSHSYPSRPVRHSYPLAIEHAGFVTAASLVGRTLPYAIVRFAVLLGLSFATIAWLLATFGIAGLLAGIHPLVGIGWMIAGLGLYGWVWRMIVRYALYLIQAGHIAVLTELVTAGSISHGSEGMFAYGKRVVTERFGEVSLLFALDLLIRGVVHAFNRTLDWIARLLPVPGLQGVAGIVNAVIRAATTYIDETIFSYNLARGDENPWRSSKDGLIYYCQNAQEILKTAAWVVVLDKVLTAVVWAVMLLPAFILIRVLPASGFGGFVTVATFVIAALFAANVRQAFLKPIFLVMVMTKFHLVVRDQPINLEWDARLSSVSSKFQEIKDKAAEAVRPATLPPPIPGTVPPGVS
jgi:hypothetical protein